jgi:hypothetical protein
MYKKNPIIPTSINTTEAQYEAETIEEKIRRIVNNKEPISDGAPIIYTERKHGVQPEFDIRTDRFEIAIEAMNTVEKSNRAKREQKIKEKDDLQKTKEPKIIDIANSPETGANTLTT